jgi:hypothetical protein
VAQLRPGCAAQGKGCCCAGRQCARRPACRVPYLAMPDVSYAVRPKNGTGLLLWLHCREAPGTADTLIRHAVSALARPVHAFHFARLCPRGWKPCRTVTFSPPQGRWSAQDSRESGCRGMCGPICPHTACPSATSRPRWSSSSAARRRLRLRMGRRRRPVLLWEGPEICSAGLSTGGRLVGARRRPRAFTSSARRRASVGFLEGGSRGAGASAAARGW